MKTIAVNEYSNPAEWISWVFRQEMAANPEHLFPLIDIYIHIFICSSEMDNFYRDHLGRANGRLEELAEFCDVLAVEEDDA